MAAKSQNSGCIGYQHTGMKISILSQAEKCQVIFDVDLPSANDDLTLTVRRHMSHFVLFFTYYNYYIIKIEKKYLRAKPVIPYV